MPASRLKGLALNLLLVGVAVVGPFVAYAGVNVIYPGSAHTVNVATSPPITFLTGSDYASAASAGFASSLAHTNNYGSFTLTLSGLSGGNVTIDKYMNLTKNVTSISSFKLQVSSALTGTLSAPTDLKIRLWAGGTAPTTDSIGSNGLCAVLDLKAVVNTETATTCVNSRWMQVIATYPAGATGSSAVTIRPSSIVFT